MKLAMLSPIAWRTPPRHYSPWESIVSLLTEGLVKRGKDTTLFNCQRNRNEAYPGGHDAGAILDDRPRGIPVVADIKQAGDGCQQEEGSANHETKR